MAMEWGELEAKGNALPPVRSSHSGWIYDNELYVFGGRGATSFLNDCYKLDLSARVWVKLEMTGQIPPPLCDFATVVIGNSVVLFGGCLEDNKLSNDTYVLTMPAMEWRLVITGGQLPPARDRHAMCCLGTRLFVFGGHCDEAEYLNDMYTLDIECSKWSLLAAAKPPTPRYHHSMDVVKDRIVVFGGKSASGCFNDVHVFDAAKGEWSQQTTTGLSPPGRWGHSTLVFDSRVVVFGGWNGTWSFNDTFCIDLDSLAWQRLPTFGRLPLARAHQACSFVQHAALGSQLIVMGGRNGLRRMNDVFLLNMARFLSKQALANAMAALRTATTTDEALALARQQQQQLMSRSCSRRSLEVAQADSKIPDLIVDPNEPYAWRLPDFELLDTLGTGSFGRVRLARHRRLNKVVAIKILKKSEIIRLKQVDHILQEKAILASCQHPFIVNLFTSFQDDRHLYLIMEYVIGGEFFTHLRKAGHFANDAARFYAAQIVLIFQYLHSKDVVYRDLKPENLLLDSRGNLKLTDFGFAKKVETRTWTLCGTPEYIAPEILLNKGHGKPVDWWALGILIYEMLSGQPPFVDDDPMCIYQKIIQGVIEYPKYFDKEAKNLIASMLQADITKRIGNLAHGVEDIKQHKWFQGLDWAKLYECEIPAPFIPEVRNELDTHNFEKYPEESTDTATALAPENESFKDF